MGKSGAVSFTKDELMQIANQDPTKLSNNVVTRPIMQELHFPTLAFIAGPGEISYWAELKLVFEHFNIKMPPIVPRLNITLLERAVESEINDLNLELSEVLSRGSVEERDRYLESIKDKEVAELFSSLKSQLL